MGLNIKRLLLLFAIMCATMMVSSAQNKTTRILFLVDASGSMKEKVGDMTKFEMAKSLLYKSTDSLSKIAGKVEVGMRLYGHQSPRSEHNCEDTKLEVNFTRNAAPLIEYTLSTINPQGWTPIAYSMEKAAMDFPDDPNSLNAIILITDGIESCDGDPCKIAKLFTEKRISLKPYIIGIGVNEEDRDRYDCVGQFYDGDNAQSFSNSLKIIISQVLNNTTVQVNLLNSSQNPRETDIPLTFSDSYTHEVLNNLVHSMTNGTPDTFYLDPIGKYDLMVHTIPPVTKQNIEIIPGSHNIIAVDVPQGTLQVQYEGVNNICPVIVRKSGSKEILNVQDPNALVKYIIGSYDLEILTLPRMYFYNVLIPPDDIREIVIPKHGTLTLFPKQACAVSILYETDAMTADKIYENGNCNLKTNIDLQPGNYVVVYRFLKNNMTIESKSIKIRIESSRTNSINLD